MDGTGSALTVIAALLGPEHLQIFAEGIEERNPRLDVQTMACAVDPQYDRDDFCCCLRSYWLDVR
jgi:hypothetical protein